MAKDKQKKKKERERRVAQKKLIAAEKRVQEQAGKATQKPVSRTTKLMTGAAALQTDQKAANAKSKNTFMHRRTGG
jgi:BarA-like signal transduction histidine kinase